MGIEFSSSDLIDQYSEASVVQDVEHYWIHKGQAYQLSGKVSALATGTSSYIYIDPSSVAHFRHYSITADDAPVDIILYEDPTVDPVGTLKTSYNRNRLSSNTSNTSMYIGPTVSAAGTEIYRDFIVAGKDTGGSSQSLPQEWVLSSSKTYLLEIANNVGGPVDFIYNFFWYEST